MLIVTINEIPGKKLEALGVVRGSTVQSRNFGHDLMAGFRTLVGGEVTDYADMLTEARQIATGRMVKDAESLGADAIVGMRYASASVMQGAADHLPRRHPLQGRRGRRGRVQGRCLPHCHQDGGARGAGGHLRRAGPV